LKSRCCLHHSKLPATTDAGSITKFISGIAEPNIALSPNPKELNRLLLTFWRNTKNEIPSLSAA
jgi:hypothetical protein